MKRSNQLGYAQILMVLLLVAGISLGAYLVGQRTNLLPKAAGNTTACDGQTLASQSTQSQNDFKAAYGQDAETQWVIEHEKELADKGTPCGSDKQEGGDCTLSNKDSITSSCANELDSKNPGFVASIEGTDKNTCTRAQIISHWCSSNPSECNAKKQGASSCGGTAGAPGTTGSSQACTTAQVQQIANTYYDAKVAQRYARYTAIINGAQEYCVQADLGIEGQGIPPLRENSKDGTVKNGRLYLCSGATSTKEKLDLVWKVISDDGVYIKESTRDNPGSDLSKVIDVMRGYIAVAKQKLGI